MAPELLAVKRRNVSTYRSLDKLEVRAETMEQMNRTQMHEARSIVENLQGYADQFQAIWSACVQAVARGETESIHSLLEQFAESVRDGVDLLKRAHDFARGVTPVTDEPAVDDDVLLPDLAALKRLQANVLDCWHTVEDLEDLAARDYPLTTDDLEKIGPQRQPPASWYAEEGKPF